MGIADDYTINATTKIIDYVGAAHGASGAGYYSGIEFHRWIQDLADDAVASDVSSDYMDITFQTPSERQGIDQIIEMKNGYTLTATAIEHLYDCSLIQNGGDDIYDGIRVVANEGVDVQIVQNGAVVANDFWNSTPNGETEKGLNRDLANGIAQQFLLQVRSSGTDIDGRRIIGQTRVWGFTFSEFRINGTARGINVLPLTYTADSNNQTANATVATWTTITNTTPGYVNLDVNNDSTDEYYYSEWNRDSYAINQFYERMKYLSEQGTSETLYGLNGELFRGITHSVTYGTPTGTFDEGNPVSWGTGATAGTGQVLADDGTGEMWIQLLTGVAPTSGVTLSQSSPDAASATASADATSYAVSTPFCGQSTGTALDGAYGFGMEVLDLGSNDKVRALDNNQYSPPNYVTFTVDGLTAGQRVLVGPYDGAGNFDFDQMSLSVTLSADNITTVTVGAGNIPVDTPATGYIRVEDDNGKYRRLHYTAWENTGGTFTIDTTDGNEDFATVNATLGNNVMAAYIDVAAADTDEAFTTIFNAIRTLYIRVRNGTSGTLIKTAETTGSLGTAGGSVTVNPLSDE